MLPFDFDSVSNDPVLALPGEGSAGTVTFSCTLCSHYQRSPLVSSPNLWPAYAESQMPTGLKEEEREEVVVKAGKGPAHEAFLTHKKK